MPLRLVLVFLCAIAVTVSGAEMPKGGNYSAILVATPAAEMPERAAELVLQASGAQLAPKTVDVVKAAVGLNPAAVLAVVGSVVESVPSMAATVAETAVTLEPHMAVAIARAAAASAPGGAESIVAAVCRVVPSDYQDVALSVIMAAPGSDRAILAGVAAAIPELKPTIEEQIAECDGKSLRAGPILVVVAAKASAADLLVPERRLGGVHGRTKPTLPELDKMAGISAGVVTARPENVAQP